MGQWRNTNGQAIYATDAGPFAQIPDWGRTTQKAQPNGGATLFLHIWEWPADGKLILPGIQQAAHSGRLLAGGAAVSSTLTDQGLVVTLPGSAPDPDVSVAALEFDKPIQIAGFDGL
jgi:alpha-L-fucosidase